MKVLEKLKAIDKDITSINFIKFDITGRKILIAEDEKLNLQFLKTFLVDAGAEILIAENGKEAIKQFKKNDDIELILMDIKMPVIDGIEATKQIRKFNTKVKIVAQTAYSMYYQKIKILESGFADYIAKPIDVSKMRQKMNKHLKQN